MPHLQLADCAGRGRERPEPDAVRLVVLPDDGGCPYWAVVSLPGLVFQLSPRRLYVDYVRVYRHVAG